MSSTLITAGDASNGLVTTGGNDNTLTLQTGAAGAKVNAIVADASGKVSFPQNQSGSAPFYSARAWCVFDGTVAGTNAPTAGGNVTSVTRNGVGDYTINLTTAMPDANFAVTATCSPNITGSSNRTVVAPFNQAPTTTTIRILCAPATTGGGEDQKYVHVVIYR